MDSENVVLSVRNLAIDYKTRKGQVNAVRDVTFDIRAGENLGLVGESGSGKSTVAYSVVGFLGPNGRVSHGDVTFKGQSVLGRSEAELRRLRGADIAMVYQEPMSALNPTMLIRDQLAESLIAHRGLSRSAAYAEALETLRRVYMPDPPAVMARYPHQISGGQQQRVVIAMAMLNNPSLLILDEPTTALDVTVEAAVLDLVAELKEKYHTAALYISHNLGVVARVSDRVAVMYAGQVVELATTQELFKRPLHPYTMGLMSCLPDVDAAKGTRTLTPIPGRVPPPGTIQLGCIFAPRCAHALPECRAQDLPLQEVRPGHWARCLRVPEWADQPTGVAARTPAAAPPEVLPVSEEVLEISQARVHYPMPFQTVAGLFGLEKRRYVKAVDGVALNVRKGRTLGIVGESGCGKSTLARAIVGLEGLRQGQMAFLGMDINKPLNRRHTDTIRDLQMVFQDPNGTLNPSYSIGEQIAASLRRFHTVPGDQVEDEVKRLLRSVKLDDSYYERMPRQLSGGEKQRIGIARAIASNPAMVVCDEPVSALDVSVQAAVLTLLLEIQHERRTSMILISHDLSVVRFFSDDVAVMYLGRIVEYGPCEAIYAPPNHPYTAALLAAVPRPDPDQPHSGLRLSGNVPSPTNPPPGCHFHPRCPFKIDGVCDKDEPPTRDMGGGHFIHCHLPPEQLHEIRA